MPGNHHLKGVGKKEQKQYEEIVKKGKGRYGNRAKEVAARTVIKHHHAEGHTKGE